MEIFTTTAMEILHFFDYIAGGIVKFIVSVILNFFRFLYQGATAADSGTRSACIVILIIFSIVFLLLAAKLSFQIIFYVIVITPVLLFLFKYILMILFVFILYFALNYLYFYLKGTISSILKRKKEFL